MAIYDMKLINHKCDKCVLFSLNITEVNLIYSAKGVMNSPLSRTQNNFPSLCATVGMSNSRYFELFFVSPESSQ